MKIRPSSFSTRFRCQFFFPAQILQKRDNLLLHLGECAKNKRAPGMSSSREPKRPGFFWQGMLIVLPVLVMAIVAVTAIRNDRVSVEREARQLGAATATSLAQAIAQEVGQQLEEYREVNLNFNNQRAAILSLGPTNAASSQSIIELIEAWQKSNPHLDLATLPPCNCRLTENRLLTLPPIEYPEIPPPPAWVRELSPGQNDLWIAAQRAAYSTKDAAAAKALLNQFLAANPSTGARANAGLLLFELDSTVLSAPELAKKILDSWLLGTQQLSESGLPISQLACYLALRRLPDHSGLPQSLLQTVASKMEREPSILSIRLLDELARVNGSEAATGKLLADLRAHWEASEIARTVLTDFRAAYPASGWSNGLFWVESSAGGHLVGLQRVNITATGSDATYPDSPTYDAFLFPHTVLEKALQAALRKTGLFVPSYARAELLIAGQWFAADTGRALPPSPTIPRESLGESTGQFRNLLLPAEICPFTVRVSLASPGLLYARQRQRTLTFCGLIFVSALAALIGYLAARRAFQKQLHLSEMKSNFVSSVSHELRAPIASVRLMAEGLERGKIQEPRKQQEYFHFIVQECRRLSSLIENVLDFSRIELGRKQYEFESTDLAALAAQTVTLMQTYADEQQIKLTLQTTGEPVPAEVDGKAIQQALVNLIDNAVKHSAKGSAVRVGLEFQPAQVSLWVEDEGEGIPPEEHEKIFERFYRLGSELRRETQGVGIGLSIVRHIVRAHGGKISVRSAVGQGSRFTINLPVKMEKAGQPPPGGKGN
jgi:signal transduction histidine kinase